jgi:hypothetical protein
MRAGQAHHSSNELEPKTTYASNLSGMMADKWLPGAGIKLFKTILNAFHVVLRLPGTVVANLKSMDRGYMLCAFPSYTQNITY